MTIIGFIWCSNSNVIHTVFLVNGYSLCTWWNCNGYSLVFLFHLENQGHTCTLSKPCKNVLINWGVPMFTKVHHVETIPCVALRLWSG